MADAPPDPTRLFRVRRTVAQMLNDRGYLVPQKELDMTREDFVQPPPEGFGLAPRSEDLTILVPRKDGSSEQMFVFFPEEVKVGVKTIKTYAERMKSESVGRAILVAKSALTPFAKQCLQEMQPKYIVELFLESELLVNITQHTLVPKHQLLSEEDKRALLNRYKVKESQLPRIQISDPVARYYGLQRGQVVRIVRPSETAGRYVTYRLCI